MDIVNEFLKVYRIYRDDDERIGDAMLFKFIADKGCVEVYCEEYDCVDVVGGCPEYMVLHWEWFDVTGYDFAELVCFYLKEERLGTMGNILCNFEVEK